MAVRKQIGAEAYDIHALRYAAAAHLAAAGCTDDEIKAITGHVLFGASFFRNLRIFPLAITQFADYILVMQRAMPTEERLR